MFIIDQKSISFKHISKFHGIYEKWVDYRLSTLFIWQVSSFFSDEILALYSMLNIFKRKIFYRVLWLTYVFRNIKYFYSWIEKGMRKIAAVNSDYIRRSAGNIVGIGNWKLCNNFESMSFNKYKSIILTNIYISICN